jgi:hypothetical protein
VGKKVSETVLLPSFMTDAQCRPNRTVPQGWNTPLPILPTSTTQPRARLTCVPHLHGSTFQQSDRFHRTKNAVLENGMNGGIHWLSLILSQRSRSRGEGDGGGCRENIGHFADRVPTTSSVPFRHIIRQTAGNSHSILVRSPAFRRKSRLETG